MMAFPEMLVHPAEKAGMNVPEDPDNFNAEKYPHFEVFCRTQLGQSMPYWSAALDNAHVIAKYTNDEIRKVTLEKLIEDGFAVGFSSTFG